MHHSVHQICVHRTSLRWSWKFQLRIWTSTKFTKTKVVMKGVNDLTLTKVDEPKILGIVTKLNKNKAHAKANLRRIASESSKSSLKSMTLRARSSNISTFVRSKLIYQFRHIDLKKTFIDKIEMMKIHSLWNKQKHSLNKNLLYYSTEKGGIGFHNL